MCNLSVRISALAALSIASALAAQSGGAYKPPRTEHGYPDLQGMWTNATITPFERPAQFGERSVYTDAEAKAIEQGVFDANAAADKPTDPKLNVQEVNKSCEVKGFSGVGCGYNNFWVDPGTKLIDINGEKRISMLVDPPNGRMPAILPAAQARNSASRAKFSGLGDSPGPEARSLGERCILSFGSSAGPPMIPLLYNNNYQIVQTRDTVTILVEMVHDARIIRIGGGHLPRSIRKWMGDSVGHYEGNTLVVETINFPEQQSFRGASPNVKVTERFTRIAPNKILYRFTVDDPATFTQPFSGEVAMNAGEGWYEYACHEGNYAMPGILADERAKEREASTEKK
jgi:hypothetical protein